MVKRNERPRKRAPKHLLPASLEPVEYEIWKEGAPENLREVWISRDYTVQVYEVKEPSPGAWDNVQHPTERLCITHTGLSTAAKANALTRDQLMDIKLQCSRGGQWAVEVFPELDRGLNLPEARHLWIYYGCPEFC